MTIQIITTPEAMQVAFYDAFDKALKMHNLITNPHTPEPPHDTPEQFNISELATYLKVTKATVHAYKKRGVFPYYQTGRTVYFKKCEVDNALASAKKKGGKLWK